MTAAPDTPRPRLRDRLRLWAWRRFKRRLPFLALYAVLAATGVLGDMRDRVAAEAGPVFAQFRDTLEAYSALKRAQMAQARCDAPRPATTTVSGHAFHGVGPTPDC